MYAWLKMNNFKEFNPADFGLDKNFKLTKFSDLRGWNCKVPQKVLTKLLGGIQTPGDNGSIG